MKVSQVSVRFLRGFVGSLTVVSLLVAPQLEAQEPETREEVLLRKRREKAQSLSPYGVTKAEARVKGIEDARFPQKIFQKGWRGFRPVIGGMPSGSGTVLGGGYIRGLETEYFQFQANGRWSTKGYTMADAELVIPPPQIGRRIELKLRGEYRDFTSLRFYGLGNDSSADDESTYLLNDRSVTGYFWLNPRGLLSLGAMGGFVSTLTDGSGEDDSIEDVFAPGAVPGFQDPRTEYGFTGGWVELDIRNKWEEPPVGIVARVTSARYEDTGISRHDFTRIVGDVKAYVPLGRRNRVLALRLRTSHSLADDGKEVPFYLMESLGGAKDIRGFLEYRFRDTRNFLVSAEYRWEVWNYTDFSFFFDAGKVFHDPSDFNFKDMHTGYGFGVRVSAPPNFVLRFDLANSTEGLRFHVSGGPSF